MHTPNLFTVVGLFACLLAAPALLRADNVALLNESPTERQAIAFMESADSARIFTVDPNGKRGTPRELDHTARKAFIVFISSPDNFGHPLGMPIAPPDAGIEFQKGGRKVTLYTTWYFSYFYDHFEKPGDSQGMNFLAVLNQKEYQLTQKWEQKYFPSPVYLPHPVVPAPANGN